MKKLSQLLFVTAFLSSMLQINAQTNWVTKPSGTTENLLAIKFLDANNGFACGNNGTVIKTVDGGTTWSSINTSSTFPVQDIFFLDVNTGWAVTGDTDTSSTSGEIWKTTNGGVNWTSQTLPSTEARLGVVFLDANNGFSSGSRNGAINVYSTTDGGTTWVSLPSDGQFGWTFKMDALSTTELWVAGKAFFPSQTGFVLGSTNGGTNWSVPALGTIDFLYDVEAVNSNTIYFVGDGGYITGTTDGGANWSAQTSGTIEILWEVSFIDATTGLISGDNGTILGTTDGGTTWLAETSGVTDNLNGIDMFDGTTAWAVGDGGLILKREMNTGIENNQEVLNVLVFPNPFSDYTTITFDGIEMNENASFVLFDAVGNIVLQKNINTTRFTLEKNQLAKGLYHYAVTGNNTVLNRGKIIIQ